MTIHPRSGGRTTCLVLVLALCSAPAAVGCRGAPSKEDIPTVRGEACGFTTNVGLFGGPQQRRGCGQQGGAATSESPSVTLPAGGSAGPVVDSDPDGATAMYGPAPVFAGIWPEVAATAPPSGPISVSTQGTPGGSVVSSFDIGLRSPANPASPGGLGPGPVQADEVRATCTADASGATGSTTFGNGILYTATDETGAAVSQEPIPSSPPPNYTRSVRINNVGGKPTIVFNEHLVNPDGSLTVNAYHMYLMGPHAMGEQIVGQVTCGTTPSPLSTEDTTPPVCGLAVVMPVGVGDLTPAVPAVVEIGLFDTGGLASISTPNVTNGSVRVGRNPDSEFAYLRFIPGQTGPLAFVATRADEDEPMSFSFVATDKAGNPTDVTVDLANLNGLATPTSSCTRPPTTATSLGS